MDSSVKEAVAANKVLAALFVFIAAVAIGVVAWLQLRGQEDAAQPEPTETPQIVTTEPTTTEPTGPPNVADDPFEVYRIGSGGVDIKLREQEYRVNPYQNNALTPLDPPVVDDLFWSETESQRAIWEEMDAQTVQALRTGTLSTLMDSDVIRGQGRVVVEEYLGLDYQVDLGERIDEAFVPFGVYVVYAVDEDTSFLIEYTYIPDDTSATTSSWGVTNLVEMNNEDIAEMSDTTDDEE